jgi:hypothetical protein
MAVVWGILMFTAAGILLWLLVDLRVAPRLHSAAQRERAARLRLEVSRRRTPKPRRSHAAASPLTRSLPEAERTPPKRAAREVATANTSR